MQPGGQALEFTVMSRPDEVLVEHNAGALHRQKFTKGSTHRNFNWASVFTARCSLGKTDAKLFGTEDSIQSLIAQIGLPYFKNVSTATVCSINDRDVKSPDSSYAIFAKKDKSPTVLSYAPVEENQTCTTFHYL